MPSIVHVSMKDKHRLARTVGRHLKDRAGYTALEFVAAAEKAAEEHPDEWTVFWTLGDKYLQMGRYADALRASRRCIELRPADIRSVYARATAYNMLTRAAWSAEEFFQKQELERSLLPPEMRSLSRLTRELVLTELDKTGLEVDTAAVEAMRWFEYALTLDPDNKSRAQIQSDLATLYKRFHHLRR